MIGSTKPANDHHWLVLDREARCVISTDDGHILLADLCFKEQCTPTLIARVANPRVSSSARLDTAATRTLMRGQRRYSSVIMMTELPMFSASTMVGVSRAKLTHVAPVPTHNGVMTLMRSAFVSKASTLAMHWMVFATIQP